MGFVCVLRNDSAFGKYAALQLLPFTGKVQEGQAFCLAGDLLCSAFHFHRKPFLHVMHLKTQHRQRIVGMV